MEEILKQMIYQLKSLEWGKAQENVDGAIAYLGCAVQNLRNPTTGAVDKGKDAVDLAFDEIVEDTVYGEGA